MLEALWTPLRQRHLIGTLARRELAGRHRASLLGALWFVLTPLLSLAVFTFVFGSVLSARFPGQPDGGLKTYALMLFTGLALALAFNEVVGRAPSLVVSQPNYVKKIVFPLHTLPWVDAGVAAVTLGFSLLLVLVVTAWGAGGPAPSWLALPLVLLPFALLAIGLGWVLAALGPYFRDLAQLVPPVLTAMMFLGPVMYPRNAAPAAAREWMLLNPLTVPVEQTRRLVFEGAWPEWSTLAVYSAVAIVVYFAGYALFKRLMKGFADVL